MWKTHLGREFGEKYFDRESPVLAAFYEAVYAIQEYGVDFRSKLNEMPNYKGLENDHAKFTVVMRAKEFTRFPEATTVES